MAIWNRARECCEREERAQEQWEHLQITLNRAYKNVPFYRNRLQSRAIAPPRVESLTDLRRIPFTARHDFSDQYPYGLFAVPLRDIVRIHTAPGTSLNPTVSGYTRSDLRMWREIAATGLAACGVGADDIMQIILDPGLANWGRDYKDGAEELGASVIPLNALHLKKQLMVLRDYKISVLITTPTSAVELLELLYAINLNPNALALRVLILVGEPLAAEVRRQLEDELHVSCWCHYGLSEIPGPAVAFECEQHRGLHLQEDHFLAEILTDSGEAIENGEPGELILTTLTTRAFPLIRFRTGDRARIISEPCACGRTLKRIEWLPERADGMLVFRGVKLHDEQILAHVEHVLGTVPSSWRIRLEKEGARRELVLSLAMDERLFSDEIKELEQVVWRLESELLQELGIPVAVRLQERLE